MITSILRRVITILYGQMMPDNWKETMMDYDAIYYGAVGWPESVPDHVSLWGSLIQFRRQFEQYVPASCQVNARCSITSGEPSPGDIDFYVVRENSEGEYSSVGSMRERGH